MNVVAHNPFRILGMFANDPLRTQTANIARIRAFNKVGKDGYVSKDVCSLINNAARETAKADLEFISMQILLDTIEKYKNQFPSVSKDVLKQHERLREEFENHIGRKPIGFTQQ